MPGLSHAGICDPGFRVFLTLSFFHFVSPETTMNDPSKPAVRIIPDMSVRRLLAISPARFKRLERLGVFRRIPGGYNSTAVVRAYARACEVEREANVEIDAIKARTKRRLATIGAEEHEAAKITC